MLCAFLATELQLLSSRIWFHVRPWSCASECPQCYSGLQVLWQLLIWRHNLSLYHLEILVMRVLSLKCQLQTSPLSGICSETLVRTNNLKPCRSAHCHAHLISPVDTEVAPASAIKVCIENVHHLQAMTVIASLNLHLLSDLSAWASIFVPEVSDADWRSVSYRIDRVCKFGIWCSSMTRWSAVQPNIHGQ